MLPAQGKRLARWATRYQLDLARELGEVEVSNIALEKRPVSYGWISALLVLSDCIAAIAITLDHGERPEPRRADTYTKATSSGE